MKKRKLGFLAVLCALLMAIALIGAGCEMGIFNGSQLETGNGDG